MVRDDRATPLIWTGVTGAIDPVVGSITALVGSGSSARASRSAQQGAVDVESDRVGHRCDFKLRRCPTRGLLRRRLRRGGGPGQLGDLRPELIDLTLQIFFTRLVLRHLRLRLLDGRLVARRLTLVVSHELEALSVAP